MNDLSITINTTPVIVKEWGGQRVLSFEDIDEVHKRPSKTAERNFNANKKRFVRGEDYFVIKPKDLQSGIGPELHEFRPIGIDVKSPRGKVFLTETGCLCPCL